MKQISILVRKWQIRNVQLARHMSKQTEGAQEPLQVAVM